MNSMNEAFEGKTTSPVEPEIPLPPECAPKQQLYVPLFFWPSVDEVTMISFISGNKIVYLGSNWSKEMSRLILA